MAVATSGPGPNQAPMGSQPVAGVEASRWAEVWVGIFFPLAIPAAFLATARHLQFPNRAEAFRIDEICFAFAAVAIAALVRTVSRAGKDRSAFIYFAVSVIAVFSLAGAVLNVSNGVDEIIHSIEENRPAVGKWNSDADDQLEPGRPSAEAFAYRIAELDSRRRKNDPGIEVWLTILGLGATFCVVSTTYILTSKS